MSKISKLYQPGDIKYFRGIHKQRQKQMGYEYVTYPQFWRRLESGMTLKEAIYTPCNIGLRRKRKPSINVEQRKATLKENDIREKGERLDSVFEVAEDTPKSERYIPVVEHKRTLRDRFISFLKQWQKNKRP